MGGDAERGAVPEPERRTETIPEAALDFAP